MLFNVGGLQNSNKGKDFIIDILSSNYPSTAKKIYYLIKKYYGTSITYQAVHKLTKELVNEKILIELNRKYMINIEWLDEISIFSKKIKNIYLNKQEVEEIKEEHAKTSLEVIEEYKKKLKQEFEKVKKYPILNLVQYSLTEFNNREITSRDQNALKVVKRHRINPLLILGDSGSGKTTLLKIIALEYAIYNLIPIYIKLNNYQGEDLIELVKEQINALTSTEVNDEVIKLLLHEGSFIILFDALNEAIGTVRVKDEIYNRYQLTLEQLNNFIFKKYSKNQFVISCRTYNDPKISLPISTFKTQLLTDKMVETFLGQNNIINLFKKIKKDKRLFSLCKNPLMLSMLIKISEQKKIKLNKKGEIYAQFINEFLWGWESKNIKANKEIIINDILKFLPRLAYEMSFKGTSIPCSTAHLIMEKKSLELGMSKSYLNEVIYFLLNSQLIKSNNNEYEFMHQSFQEYFAALELKNKKLTERELHKLIKNKDWHEILIFYSDLSKKVPFFVENIYNLFKKNKDHTFLFLAAKCITTKKNIPSKIFNKIINSFLEIYNYPDDKFYLYWYELNHIFQSWQNDKVTKRLIDFFSSCKDEVSPRLVNMLHHSNKVLQRDEGIKKLQEYLETKNKHLKYSIIEIMGLRKNPNVIKYLIKFLSDKDHITRTGSVWALEQIGSEAIKKVELWLKKKKNKTNALQFLNKIKQDSFNELLQYLNKKEEFIRGHAIHQLSRINYQKALPYILKCLKDESASIRYHATYIIPDLSDEDGNLLINFLNNKNQEEYKKIISSIK